MTDGFSNGIPAQRSCPNGKRVLLVDDCGELSCLTATLQERGSEVYRCDSYAEGLHQLESRPFDFLVVCQGGPQFQGKPVLERAIEIDRRMPVVVVTRCLNMKCYVDAMPLGALDYLESPQASVEIARLIETHSRPQGAAASV